jgi:hypothetical protein
LGAQASRRARVALCIGDRAALSIASLSAFPALVGRLTLIDLFLLLAAFAIVPLGLRLVPLRAAPARRILSAARLVQPAGAAAALVAFIIPAGRTAAVIAVGWVFTSAIAALAGLSELVERRSFQLRSLAPAAALVFLAVGAGWLVVSRAGWRPLGFSSDIVELTAVHFHYAGFAATLIATLTINALRDRNRLQSAANGAALAIIAGVPITAAGIASGSGVLTAVGPLLLGAGILLGASLLLIAVAPALEPTAARWLLRLSALGVVAPMLLGIDYALARLVPVPALDLRSMALIHGTLNAVVFSLMGLLGWTIALAKPGLR